MIVTLVKPFGTMLKIKSVNIYDNVFTMHTKMTVVFLLVFSILVSAYDYFGKPIYCRIGVYDNDLQKFADMACWINGTFTYRNVSTSINGQEIWQKIPQYQKYYQWIIVVLILQAIIVHLPAHLWKSWENHRMKLLCGDLGSVVIPKDYEEQKTCIIRYLKMNNSREHTFYFLRYVMCEVMNFVIVVINMVFLNFMFGEFWTRYLPAILALFRTDGEAFSTLANEIFPKLAKCSYMYTGPSGSMQIRDAYCLLSLNILNEKIFAFLYVWFIVLLVVSGYNLIIRSILLVSPALRLKLILSMIMSSGIHLTKKELEIILQGNSNGNWFVLFQLGRNLNPIIFGEVLLDIANDKVVI